VEEITLDSELSRLNAIGYEFRHQLEQEDGIFADLIVHVLYEGEDIAEGHFTDDGNSVYCQQVNVNDCHQRRGVGTAMYMYVERLQNCVLENFWANDTEYQTPAARALWAQANRPFGRRC